MEFTADGQELLHEQISEQAHTLNLKVCTSMILILITERIGNSVQEPDEVSY